MPLPFLIPITIGIITAGTTIAMGVNTKDKIDQAKSYQERGEKLSNDAKQEIEHAVSLLYKNIKALGEAKLKFCKISREVAEQLNKDDAFLTDISYGQLLVGINRNAIDSSINLADIALSSISALGAGAATCSLALGGVVAFGAASTGTAISTLSGAALSSSVIAWLGGGATALGGLGVAGGTLAVATLFAAPALLVGGFVLSSKAEDALKDARRYYDECQDYASRMTEKVNNIKASINNITKCTALIFCAANRLEQMLADYRQGRKQKDYSLASPMSAILKFNNIAMNFLPPIDPNDNPEDRNFKVNPKFVTFTKIFEQGLNEIDRLQQALGSHSSYYPTTK